MAKDTQECSGQLATREMRTETPLRNHLTCVRMAVIQRSKLKNNQKIPMAGDIVEKKYPGPQVSTPTWQP